MTCQATSDSVVAIFAKAPIEGFAKTRLIPRLGTASAAELQRIMIEDSVRTAIRSQVGSVSLWCAPDPDHAFFGSLAEKYTLELHPQTGVDLGQRMLNAFEVLSPAHPVILIGCDCPALRSSHLQTCANALAAGRDAVFIPTEDGGYALVAAKKPWPDLFLNMPWSSDVVMKETRLRAARLGLDISEPFLLWDVDTPEDYERALRLNLLRAE